MKFRAILVSLLTAAIATTAFAQKTSFIIPSAGSGAGAQGSQWRTELGVHNAGSENVPLDIRFHGDAGWEVNNGALAGPGHTGISGDIFDDILNLEERFGALVIVVDQRHADKIALAARAVNSSAAGDFGQAIPVYRAEDALIPGDTGVIIGPLNPGQYRFNLGIFPVDDATVQWELVRQHGEVVATSTIEYSEGVPVRYNAGVATLFGVEAEEKDTVRARILEGRAIPYGSLVHNVTNDGSWVTAMRVHENIAPTILGIDLDENGTIDLVDADGDGRIDGRMDVFTSTFPNYFRVVAEDEEGDMLTWTTVNVTRDIKVLDERGTIQWAPGSDVRGTEDVLIVRVSDGRDSTDIVIPVRFR